MPLALFGIDGGLGVAVNLLVLFLIVVYLALIYWTYLDARRRIEDPVLIACATAASIFPYLGTIVYTILRPPEFLEDAHERELEIKAAELRVRQLRDQSCPNCEYPVEKNYLRCPNCQHSLKDPCPTCSKPVDPRWAVCPYCESALEGRSRRRATPEKRRRTEERERATAERKPRSDGSSAPKRSEAPPTTKRAKEARKKTSASNSSAKRSARP